MSKKLRAKFPATTPSCFVVKIGHLDESSLDIFEPQASPVEGESLQQKEKEWDKKKGKKNSKVEKPKAVGQSQNFDSCACLSQKVLKRDSSGKNG